MTSRKKPRNIVLDNDAIEEVKADLESGLAEENEGGPPVPGEEDLLAVVDEDIKKHKLSR